MDNEGQMTIEELASQAGTATTTVRMYQAKGLLPPPERRGRIGYYGQGHLARLRLIAQLQEQGFSLASIKRLTDAWESGRGLEDVLGLETQVAAVWAAEAPVRLKLGEFRELFAGQRITPAVIRRAVRMGLVGFDGIWVTVNSPKLLEIGLELVRAGLPVTEMMDEMEALQGFRAQHMGAVRRRRPSGRADQAPDRITAAAQRAGRSGDGRRAPRRSAPQGRPVPGSASPAPRQRRSP
jgi:DNA-binding transcriptional MerR regulator